MTNLRSCGFVAAILATAGVNSANAGPIASTASRATERQALRRSPQELAPRVVQPDTRLHADEDRRARGLVRIGEDGIARENDAALDAYFAKNFVYHGPGGDMTYAQLKATFASMRAAFSDFAVTRPVIIVKGDMIAARTTMTGIFTGPFSAPSYGTLAPTGKPIKLELVNIFRYDADGKLAEEWVQTDRLGFLQQLGVMLQPTR